MRYFVVLSLFCLMLVTVKANAYLDNDLMSGEWRQRDLKCFNGRSGTWECEVECRVPSIVYVPYEWNCCGFYGRRLANARSNFPLSWWKNAICGFKFTHRGSPRLKALEVDFVSGGENWIADGSWIFRVILGEKAFVKIIILSKNFPKLYFYY